MASAKQKAGNRNKYNWGCFSLQTRVSNLHKSAFESSHSGLSDKWNWGILW